MVTQKTPKTFPGDPLEIPLEESAISCAGVGFSYGGKSALEDITMRIPRNQVTAFIGPSGCGKSTLLRCFNRINDRIPGAALTKGEIVIEGKNIYDKDVDVTALRRNVGMVFQKSNPFPMSIFDNVTYGLKIQGVRKRSELEDAVERSLRAAALWDELKDRLKEMGTALSGGQQQRLCIARAVAVQPRILLMDEPCSALDPIATLKIENLLDSLKREFTVVIVTHNMHQATRIADRTAFLYLGRLVEAGPTMRIFQESRCEETENYVSGRFG